MNEATRNALLQRNDVEMSREELAKLANQLPGDDDDIDDGENELNGDPASSSKKKIKGKTKSISSGEVMMDNKQFQSIRSNASSAKKKMSSRKSSVKNKKKVKLSSVSSDQIHEVAVEDMDQTISKFDKNGSLLINGSYPVKMPNQQPQIGTKMQSIISNRLRLNLDIQNRRV